LPCEALLVAGMPDISSLLNLTDVVAILIFVVLHPERTVVMRFRAGSRAGGRAGDLFVETITNSGVGPHFADLVTALVLVTSHDKGAVVCHFESWCCITKC